VVFDTDLRMERKHTYSIRKSTHELLKFRASRKRTDYLNPSRAPAAPVLG
jgi:hypothetical protein